jgi:hypothetical protein
MGQRQPGGGPRGDHLDLALAFCEDFYSQLASIENQTLNLTGPDARRDLEFTRNLFAFVCLLRTTRNYIHGLVARTVCEAQIRNRLDTDDAIAFHSILADRGLHTRLISNARAYYRGGDRDGQRRYIYAKVELEPEALQYFNALQPVDPNQFLTALELAKKALDSMRAVDAAAKSQGAY